MTEQIIFFAVILLSAVFHEYMHGWAAYQMGDTTAKDQGRLTLNPLAHIDPFYTVLLPALLYIGTQGRFMFAAAKPVPFNPYNLRYPKYGAALVGLAGPAGNFLIAIIFSIFIRFDTLSLTFLLFSVIVVYANVLLGVFNLVPIPPLDGSHILLSIIPDRWGGIARALEQYGIILFVVFLIFFSGIIYPIVRGLTTLLVGPASIYLFG